MNKKRKLQNQSFKYWTTIICYCQLYYWPTLCHWKPSQSSWTSWFLNTLPSSFQHVQSLFSEKFFLRLIAQGITRLKSGTMPVVLSNFYNTFFTFLSNPLSTFLITGWDTTNKKLFSTSKISKLFFISITADNMDIDLKKSKSFKTPWI